MYVSSEKRAFYNSKNYTPLHNSINIWREAMSMISVTLYSCTRIVDFVKYTFSMRTNLSAIWA